MPIVFACSACCEKKTLPSSRSLLEEAILDRLPYPFLDQSLGDVRYASAMRSELGQLVQVLPGCHGKC